MSKQTAGLSLLFQMTIYALKPQSLSICWAKDKRFGQIIKTELNKITKVNQSTEIIVQYYNLNRQAAHLTLADYRIFQDQRLYKLTG